MPASYLRPNTESHATARGNVSDANDRDRNGNQAISDGALAPREMERRDPNDTKEQMSAYQS
jgi:hypothetical protein